MHRQPRCDREGESGIFRTVNGAEPKKAARKRQTSSVSMFFASAQGMLKMANKA